MTEHEESGENAPSGRRQGLALIIVLGLCAVLMIMGVAFSISMRVERLGAGSFRFGVNARNMVWAGLARAMDDINQSMATNGSIYPAWEVLPSSGMGSGVRMVFVESLRYVPGALTQLVSSTDVQWITDAKQGGGGSIQGRMAFLVVNTGGLLDANYAGGTNRGIGYSPRELCVSNLPEMASVVDFDQARSSGDKRYETLPELYYQQADPAGPLGGGLKDGVHPSNFVVYSRFPLGSLIGSAVSKDIVDIGGDEAQLNNKHSEIVAKLKLSGIEDAQAEFVFTNLLDYIDADHVPRDLGSACTEKVPMINEVCFTGLLVQVGGVVTSGVQVKTEWLYPFVCANGDIYRLRTQVTLELKNTSASTTTGPINESDVQLTGLLPTDTRRYGVVSAPPAPTEYYYLSIPATNNNLLTFSAQVRLTVIDAAGTVVDAVPFPTNGPPINLEIANVVTPAEGAEPVGFEVSVEAVDPRFNWDSAPDSAFWDPAKQGGPASTLGTTNFLTKLYFDLAPTPDNVQDWDTDMHVSDKGRLYSVGELGNLLRGGVINDHWFKTVRLFDDQVPVPGPLYRKDEVLRYFTVTPTNAVKHGLVNINTTNRQVLASLFLDTPWGHPDSPERVKATEVDALANMLINYRQSGRVFTNVADIGSFDWRGSFPSRSDVERESIIAHSCELMGTRQNLFTIFVAAGPFAPGQGIIASEGAGTGDWLGYQRAVFEVWRDPFPDAQGRHPWFVRLFKLLEGGD